MKTVLVLNTPLILTPLDVWVGVLQGGPLGVLPGHLADHLQRAGASPRPDEGVDLSSPSA